MTSSKFIDPVLSSTIDFDNYIKHHLTTSSRERKTPRSNSDDAPIHRIHGRKTLDDDTTAANRIHNGKSRRDHQMVPMVDASLQASMLQVNACRYNLNSTGSSSRSEKKQQQQKDTKGRTSQTVSNNAVEPLVLQHSWRAYLKHDGRYGADSIARDDRTSKHLEVVPLPRPLMFDDDELTCDDLPRSHVPKPIRSIIDNVILTGGSGKEDDGWAFSEYRVRLVSLKHFFNVWRVESVRVHLLLYKRSAAVVAASRLHCLSLIMGYWRRYLQSGRFHCTTLCRRGLSKLLSWRLRSRRYGRPQIDDGYYWVVQCRLSMRAFGYNRRMELDRQRRRALTLICVRHYQCSLAKAVFLGWKRYCSRARNEQMLRTEHSARQDKISSFMSSLRIQHGGISSSSSSSSSNHRVVPPKAPPAGPRATTSTSITSSSASYAQRTLKGDSGDKSISSSRHPPRRSNSSSSKSSADITFSIRSRSDYYKAVQGRSVPVHVDDAVPLRKLTSSDGDDARNTDMSSSYFTSDKAESKMRTCSSDVDVQSCGSDEDGDAASSVAVRAPSYDEVMKSANPKDALLLMRGEAAADHPAPHPPSRLDAKNRELSMEERHRERKERVASLQRQAEERVSARNRERELNEK